MRDNDLNWGNQMNTIQLLQGVGRCVGMLYAYNNTRYWERGYPYALPYEALLIASQRTLSEKTKAKLQMHQKKLN